VGILLPIIHHSSLITFSAMISRPTSPDAYAVIGHPVKHSFSPFIHGMFAKQCKQSLTYRLLNVAPENLTDEVIRFFVDHGKGLNVTIPHKQKIVALCKYRTPRAEIAGAVNTIAVQEGGDLLGDNTDGVGLITDLVKNLSVTLKESRILLVGAGGAARGVVGPLLEQAPASLHIVNRDDAKAEVLAKEFASLGTVSSGGFESADTAYDLVINATAASLQGTVPPISTSVIGASTVCYDMAYGKEDTIFVRWAKEHGAARAELGWGMLVEQAAESFYLWRGVRPDTAPVLQAVRSPTPVLSHPLN
jgi:shikimate dehydrogenase